METNSAHVDVTIRSGIDRVWKALTDPAQIERYMMGAQVTSDWKEGSAITWKGEWNGKSFEDTGRVLESDAPHRLRYTHQSGQGDEHTVTVELDEADGSTRLHLTQDRTPAGKARDESEKNWRAMLGGLKEMLEKK
jgi:uncharacterized protein YndB with AHSA1/START domain